METIKIGDYVEGIEQLGPGGFEHLHKMRIIVDNILSLDGHAVYSGQADDSYGGARSSYVSTKFGEVKIITGEKPFTTRWWEQLEGEKKVSNDKTEDKER